MLASAFLDENNKEHEVLDILDLITNAQGSDAKDDVGEAAGSKTAKDNGDYSNEEEKKSITGSLSLVEPRMVAIVALEKPE